MVDIIFGIELVVPKIYREVEYSLHNQYRLVFLFLFPFILLPWTSLFLINLFPFPASLHFLLLLFGATAIIRTHTFAATTAIVGSTTATTIAIAIAFVRKLPLLSTLL